MTNLSYNHLSPEERGKIEAYLDEGLSQAEIARRLDRHRSTRFQRNPKKQ